MKVAFFTESRFSGKVPRTHKNMRTDLAWQCALQSDHYCIYPQKHLEQLKGVGNDHYDIGIVIVPKQHPVFKFPRIREVCKKVGVMQEGPHWNFQDWPLDQQFEYLNLLQDGTDFLMVHNRSDVSYFYGMTSHHTILLLQSLMIETPELHSSVNWDVDRRDGAMIGGNFCTWYGGMDSFAVVQELGDTWSIPSMGRKVAGEEGIVGLNHLPYMNWFDWMVELSKHRYAVHMMRTHAAGTFALNCAFLGIPCIGYDGLDTQMKCHPHSTVPVGDVMTARHMAASLLQDRRYYDLCSRTAKERYATYYSESAFLENFHMDVNNHILKLD